MGVAQLALGMMLLGGEGGEIDGQQGRELLIAAGTAGLVPAQFALGLAYAHGLGVEPNTVGTAYWFCKAAEQGHGMSQFFLGCLYEQAVPPDHLSALYWLKKAAAQNVQEANAMLSTLHRAGHGVPKSDSEANKHLLLAAKAGHPPSQYLFGVVCLQGLGVEKDPATAIKWLRAAADKGDADAQNELGGCYQKGIGVTADIQEAAKWYELAAENGHDVAPFNAGFAFMSGKTPEDQARGVRWMQMAAANGNPDAQYIMGGLYLGGYYGTKKSKAVATFWYMQATAQGVENAKLQLRAMAMEK